MKEIKTIKLNKQL